MKNNIYFISAIVDVDYDYTDRAVVIAKDARQARFMLQDEFCGDERIFTNPLKSLIQKIGETQRKAEVVLTRER